MKYLILFVLILIILVLYKKMNSKKTVVKNIEIEEPKVSFIAIDKSNEKKENFEHNALPYNFVISSITKKEKTLELLISIENHTHKTIRINLKEATYFSSTLQEKIKADVTFYGELNMGTNDILLKNTILPEAHVIRNIYFFDHNFSNFNEMDFVEITLEIHQQVIHLKQYLYESNLDSVKFVH